jgi:uncharacterized protein YciI
MTTNHAIAIWLVAISALIGPASLAVAATQSDFDCSRKIVVIYRPGPNWSQFKERLSDHLDYVKAKVDEKTMVFGSPMSDRSGQPIGGLFIYNVPSLDGAEKMVQEDTFVRDQVVVYSLAFWGMCQGKALVK